MNFRAPAQAKVTFPQFQTAIKKLIRETKDNKPPARKKLLISAVENDLTLGIGLIIAISVGSIVFVPLVLALLFFLYCWKKEKSNFFY